MSIKFKKKLDIQRRTLDVMSTFPEVEMSMAEITTRVCNAMPSMKALSVKRMLCMMTQEGKQNFNQEIIKTREGYYKYKTQNYSNLSEFF